MHHLVVKFGTNSLSCLHGENKIVKGCDFLEWQNWGINFFGHNLCLVSKSKLLKKMYYEHINTGAECKRGYQLSEKAFY